MTKMVLTSEFGSCLTSLSASFSKSENAIRPSTPGENVVEFSFSCKLGSLLKFIIYFSYYCYFVVALIIVLPEFFKFDW